ncbi:AAA family ATPase [Kitasatospora sp. YST-16]|uniref:AAA family ATPase n=1 Tax=Kitasatospora sp. YST-16 TaxID=2998080 RepID=UPI002283379D|nr:AAA family ATPase [Kitasatospora sp. YST-16]WAL70341.1 AAA family ATPase [Kitasatospora sp. YST-16]WNW36382.1 AAA family ATPase [Streptomyces sp. Li-HN-5-13]
MPPQLRPHARHDLTGRPAPARLAYPADDVLVVSGLPGSGKSTLMRRCARARVIDSQHTRARFARALPGVPYALYRPLVRLAHYLRLRAAVRAGGPLVVHDCGTLPWVRRALARATARQGRRLHLLLLDATPAQAADGQRRRGRRVSRYAFARHRRSAATLRALVTAAGPLPPGVASAVLLPRAAAPRLTAIEFTPAPAPAPVPVAVPVQARVTDCAARTT